MSQLLRESLNPGGGLEDHHHSKNDQQEQQQQQQRNTILSIVVDPPSSDEAEGGQTGQGNDSDPPIENENPEGDKCCTESRNVSNSSGNERKKEIENAKKRVQLHHRKRRKSTHNADTSYVPPYKKNRFRHLPSVLPSKFLLGGNIRDPLNLASLSDARISAELNKSTPHSSPLPVQGEVPVFIPKNPQDPLGLTTKTPENVQDIVAGVRKNSCSRKHRHRKRPGRKRTDSECSIGNDAAAGDHVAEDGTDINMLDVSKNQRPEEVPQEEAETGKGKVQKEAENRIVLKSESEAVSKGKNADILKPTATAVKNSANTVPILVAESSDIGADTKFDNPSKIQMQGIGFKESTASTSRKAATESSATTIIDESNDSRHSGVDHEEYEYQDYIHDEESRHYHGTGPYQRSSSDYNPMSNSTYAPSPFAFDSTEYFLEAPPYESPFSHFAYTPTHYLQPFSPPPLPEIPPFQRRMQMFSARPQHLSLQRAVFHRPFRPFPKKRGAKNRADPIVSPVIPQPGSRRRGHHFHSNNHKKPGDKANTSGDSTSTQQLGDTSTGTINDSVDGSNQKKYRSKDKIFEFGNYSHYYGYRTAEQGDPRLWALKKEYFQGKEILDIGCNSGHVTLSIARDFEPRRIHGIDIDYSLITAARKNIKHYMIRDPDNKNIVFPRSLPMIYGAMQPPPAPGEKTAHVFPYNVSFAHENYVLTSDSQLDNVKPQYDVIVCFSVTKWIHLNFGDDGLKRFFRRIFRHLHAGGILVLEPQPWSSYIKKKKLTEKVHQMFQRIKFFPDQFQDFLLNEVGFSTSESLGTPVHNSKGFQRPLIVFVKSKETLQENIPMASDPKVRSTRTPSSTITSESLSKDGTNFEELTPPPDNSTSLLQSTPTDKNESENRADESGIENLVSSSSDHGR